MKKRLTASFRTRLFGALLAAALVPLLICSAMLLQIFRLRMTDTAEEQARDHLGHALRVMDEEYAGFSDAVDALRRDPLVLGALTVGGVEDTQVNAQLFSAAGTARNHARFDLYDKEGNWRYSTRNAPAERRLSLNWGVLYQAEERDALAFTAAGDPTDTGSPLLLGAAVLTDQDGGRAGYVVISLYQSDLRQMLEGVYGAQGTLILLSDYWRPVYCAQPSLAVSLSAELRGRLLSGQGLEGFSDNFLYSVERHAPMGLYLVLQRPQVFNRETMGLLYTVSASSALICVVISVLMSLSLSRQMFRPIAQFQGAIREVERDNLDVQVARYQDDELGELAQRFNDMVAALKRNRELLVENQRELNEAQIRMLQAQLNPHFLCNTLDTMKWISKINKVPQVALMSTDLADILRFCISPEEFVPLGREAEILMRYIEIQRIRLSDSFAFTLSLPATLEDCLVPKMILQPIVENAILHGVDGVENGTVEVDVAETAGGMLRLTVADNGAGFPPDMLGGFRQIDRRQGHLGLYNVDTILLKYYGEGYGLTLQNSAQGKGAVVMATLPIRRKEGAEC
ncbi:MAG: sensor histidine kinase [Oscillospiraceae bacterium]|nr:sensor histidine kinase [Oscillospiraceae bacterium]